MDTAKYRKETREFISVVRCYFRLGLSSPKLSFFEVADRIRGFCRHDPERARELLAVHELFRYLRVGERHDMLDLLFYLAGRGSRGKSSLLVFSMTHYCDERTAYRYISYMIRLYVRFLSL